MTGYSCDVCGQPASVYVTEIRDGKRAQRNLCDRHADLAGVTAQAVPDGPMIQMTVNGTPCSSVHDAVMTGILDNLRGTASFARRHGRMPASVEELREGMALQGDFEAAAIMDSTLRTWLNYATSLIDYCQTHGRLPQPEDLPPMPPNVV